MTLVVLSGETELCWEETDGGGVDVKPPTAPLAASSLFCCGGRGGQESRSGSSLNAWSAPISFFSIRRYMMVVKVAMKVYQQAYLSANYYLSCLPQLLNHPRCLAFLSVTAIFLYVQLLSSILPNTFHFSSYSSQYLTSTFFFFNLSSTSLNFPSSFFTSLALNEPPSGNP